jgi:ABC-type cobalamin transport system permease subunit
MHSFEEIVDWDLRLPNAGIVAIFGVFHAMCVTLLRQLLSTNAVSEPTADKESKTRVAVFASVRITNVVLSTLAMMKDRKGAMTMCDVCIVIISEKFTREQPHEPTTHNLVRNTLQCEVTTCMLQNRVIQEEDGP